MNSCFVVTTWYNQILGVYATLELLRLEIEPRGYTLIEHKPGIIEYHNYEIRWPDSEEVEGFVYKVRFYE